MKEELVTAVITTYRRPIPIVKRAIDSVISQTYREIEILVVNDAPEDKKLHEQLKALVESYHRDNLFYVAMTKNGGACKARNFALKRAKGVYIAFLDDDDEWLPEKIKLQVEMSKLYPNAKIIACNSYIYNEETQKETIRFKEYPFRGLESMYGENIIGSCSFPLFPVHLLRQVGGFREDIPALQDWELYLRIIKTQMTDKIERDHFIAYVEQPVARYHFYRGDRISAHPERRTQAFEFLLKEHQLELEQYPKVASKFYLMGTYFYSLAGEYEVAGRYYFQGIVKDFWNIKRNVIDFFRMVGRVFFKPKLV